MLTQKVKFAVIETKKIWWKILAKKAQDTAVKVISHEATQEVAKNVAVKGADVLIKKAFSPKTKNLDKKLKKLKKMYEKGNLDAAEYRKLRDRIIENADAAEI